MRPSPRFTFVCIALLCVLALSATSFAQTGGDDAIARGVEDPTAMRGYEPIDDDSVGRECAKGADLIPAHESAVARNIGGENRGELSFDGRRFQGSAPPQPGVYTGPPCEIRGVLSHSEAR